MRKKKAEIGFLCCRQLLVVCTNIRIEQFLVPMTVAKLARKRKREREIVREKKIQRQGGKEGQSQGHKFRW